MPEPLGSARATSSQLIYWICSSPPWAKILPASIKQYPVTMLPRELSPYQDGLWVLKNPCQLTFIFSLISSQVASAIAIVCSAQYLSVAIIKMLRAISLAKKQSQGPFLHIDPSWTHFISVLTLSANAGEAGDSSLIPESGRYPGEENGNPLQYSRLENSMNRGSWQTTVLRMAKSWTQLSMHACITLLTSPAYL